MFDVNKTKWHTNMTYVLLEVQGSSCGWLTLIREFLPTFLVLPGGMSVTLRCHSMCVSFRGLSGWVDDALAQCAWGTGVL